MSGRDVHPAHRDREGGHDQDERRARFDQVRHAPQRADMVDDVLQHVVGDQAGVLAGLLAGQVQFANIHIARFDRHPVFQRHQPTGLGLRTGEAAHLPSPLQRVVPEPAAHFDGVLAEERPGDVGEPPAMVDGLGESLEHLFLLALVASKLARRAVRLIHGKLPSRGRCEREP
jgi:hypothetical protein